MSEDKEALEDELRPEYDLSQLEPVRRGKFYERYGRGTNLALLAPDVANVFPDDDSVNDALRLLIKLAKKTVPLSKGRKLASRATSAESSVALAPKRKRPADAAREQSARS